MREDLKLCYKGNTEIEMSPLRSNKHFLQIGHKKDIFLENMDINEPLNATTDVIIKISSYRAGTVS